MLVISDESEVIANESQERENVLECALSIGEWARPRGGVGVRQCDTPMSELELPPTSTGAFPGCRESQIYT